MESVVSVAIEHRLHFRKRALISLRAAKAEGSQSAPVDRRQSESDAGHAEEVVGREMFAEEQRAEEDRRHRNEEGDEHQVDGAGGGKDAVEDDVGEGRGEDAQAEQGNRM